MKTNDSVYWDFYIGVGGYVSRGVYVRENSDIGAKVWSSDGERIE